MQPQAIHPVAFGTYNKSCGDNYQQAITDLVQLSQRKRDIIIMSRAEQINPEMCDLGEQMFWIVNKMQLQVVHLFHQALIWVNAYC